MVGCREKTQLGGRGGSWGQNLGSQPPVGKGCYVSYQEDQTTYFGLHHCAPAYCADVKIHTARVGLQQNTLIPPPSHQLPATPIVPMDVNRFQPQKLPLS